MSNEHEAGGFFFRLGLKTDKDSFDKGRRSVEDMSNSVNRLVGTIRNAAPLITAGLAGKFETAELKTAQAIGISTDALDEWKTAAQMAGTNVSALTSSMAQLETKMQGLKLGQVDQGLAKTLGHLGIGYGDFAKMDATQRMRAVFQSAQAMKDQQKAALLVGQVLGSAGQDYYYYLQLSGKSLDSQLDEGKRLTFTTEESKRQAMEFNHELMAIKAAGTSMAMLFGSKVGAELTPTITKFKEYLELNHDFIESGITDFVGTLGDVFNRIVDGLDKAAPIVSAMIEGFGGLDKVIVGVGLGLAGLKIAEFAGQIGIIAGSLNPIVLGLGALAALSLPDLLKDKDTMESLAKSGKELWEALKGLGQTFGPTILEGFKEAAGTLAHLIGALDKATRGDWSGAMDSLKKIITTDSEEGKSKARNLKSLGVNDTSAELISIGTSTSAGKALFDGVIGAEAAMSVISGERATDLKNATENLKKLPENMDGDINESSWVTRAARASQNRDVFSHDDPWAGKLKKVHDGIIKPNGQVTQVAPDDWVFAARNVSDLAAAFMPAGYGGNSYSGGEFVINQTFNVSGSGDLGFNLRQQAYNGVKEGMQQVLAESSRRLQLMPGAR